MVQVIKLKPESLRFVNKNTGCFCLMLADEACTFNKE